MNATLPDDILDIFDEEADTDKPKEFTTAAEIRAFDYRAEAKWGLLGKEAVARDIYFRHVGVYLDSWIVAGTTCTPRQMVRLLNSMGYLEGLLNTKAVGELTVTYSIINRYGDDNREYYSRVVYMVFEMVGRNTKQKTDPIDAKCRLVNYVLGSSDVSVAECMLYKTACSIKI